MTPMRRTGVLGRAVARLAGRIAAPPEGLTKAELAERRRVRDGLAAVQADLDAGRLAAARRRVDDLARELPGNTRIQDRRAAVLELAGEVTEPLRIVARLNERRPEDERVARERRLAALLVETAPGWLPRVPGPARPGAARPGVAAHIVGAGSRSAAETEALAATGTTLITIDLAGLAFGAWYPADRPLPERLEDEAWLAARVARGAAPAVLHATADARGSAVGLVGLALHAHLGRPLVYEPPHAAGPAGPAAGAPGGGELTRRREAVDIRLLAGADAVVVWTEAARRHAAAVGANPDRVVVVEPGTPGAAERLADLYRALAAAATGRPG